jgi:hypothetical protein
MLSSTNFWMCFAGLIYLVAGVFIFRKEISAARGWEKLITLGSVFIAVPLAVFAPEHFSRPRVCPEYGPGLDAGSALVLGVFCRMRTARSSYQSYVEEVRTLVVNPARIDVLSICLHDLSAESAQTFHESIRVDLPAKRSLFCRRRMGTRRSAVAHRVAAIVEMDDFICARCDSNGGDLLWRTTFSSSTVYARRSFGIDNAIVGSIPQRVGIPHRSDPAGFWNRLDPEQNISDSRSLDWRINDRPHSIPISAYFDPRPRIIGGDQ